MKVIEGRIKRIDPNVHRAPDAHPQADIEAKVKPGQPTGSQIDTERNRYPIVGVKFQM